MNQKKKWFEEENACPYRLGNVISIIDGPLKGRSAVVDKPASKKNAVKAYLFDKKGNMQKTNITLDFKDIEMLEIVEVPFEYSS